MLRVICLATVLIVSQTIDAQEPHQAVVENLYHNCKQPENSVSHDLCLGYVSGVVDTMTIVGQKANAQEAKLSRAVGVCGNGTHNAAIQAFINWAEKNPDKWGLAMVLGVIAAERDLWPCK